MLLRSYLLISLGVAALSASEALDKILADWDAETLKSRQAYDTATGKAADKAGKALEATATAAGKKGDIAGASAAWKTLLSINPDHAKAREFFTATGNLDAVLKEVTQTTDLLGNPIASTDLSVMPADAKPMDISATPGREAPIGRLKTGATIMVQYVQGLWNPRIQMGEMSPDAAEAPDAYRLVLIDRSNGKVIATVPAGTAAKPFALKLMNPVVDAVLTMAPPANPRAVGTVTYHVAVIP